MNKKVIVYSTPVCPYCVMAKDFLKEKSVNFQEVDIMKDQKAAQEVIKKTGQMGVPVIEIDDKFIVGFDQSKIEQLLK